MEKLQMQNQKNLTEKNLKQKIGENLFKIRRDKNLSLTQASMLLKINKSQVDWLERGYGCMNLRKLSKISNNYQIDIWELFR
jgi:transcriptional regulator with XRE-family HTH domain